MLPDIYTYIDYRQYLMDVFEVLCKKDSSFSYRSFSRIAGSTSPNYLQLIRDRKLNITDSSVTLIAQTIGLKKKEHEFLKILVAFDQAKNSEEKDTYFKKILFKREYKSIKTLTNEQYQFFSQWYIPIIRELVVLDAYQGDPSWIAKKIIPPVSESKVRKGITVLEKLNLIKRNKENDKWQMNNTVISSASEVLSLAITKYHKTIIPLAADSIDRFPKQERDIRSVTVGLSEDGYKEVKKRFGSFWREMLDFASNQKNIKRVYQINMQLFPLTNKDKER